MRIAHCIRALIAVLGLTAIFQSAHSSHHESRHRLRHYRYPEPYNSTVPLQMVPSDAINVTKYARDNLKLLREEFRVRDEVDCCPTVREMIEPEGGENQEGNYVELFKGELKQRFYELSCHPDILNKTCRFIDKKLHQQSKCVQKYSFTYALIKDPGGKHKNFPSFPLSGPDTKDSWRLDYIKVRSGCSCVITERNGPGYKKKRARNRARNNND
ncbi:unnamed protein product [Brassicogethes aeneus]|uniref:Spaetzle domain-containing protein n=1 Tax=Brassicogethes aeneus TaxID=1431903 RepID=A0A9P0BCN3_BRAAE|nr:unnamed protein product [Brassicogethes aeneus]